jgi:hypothetical protein
MKKEIGKKVTFRGTATYNHSEDRCDSTNSRGSNEDVITKVFTHGVRTKKNGYVNNKRILNIEE